METRGTIVGCMVHDVIGAVARAGGVAQVGPLERSGHSRYRIAQAVASGGILRVRRGWVALPDADAELIAAARCAVVLACITQARRRGLWVLSEPQPHVCAEPHGAGSKPTGLVVHWQQPVVPRVAGTLEDPIENVLDTVASCQPFEVALAIWDSAMRQNLVTFDGLRTLDLGPRARRVLAETTPYADSGLETMFRTRLRWLKLRILFQIWIEGTAWTSSSELASSYSSTAVTTSDGSARRMSRTTPGCPRWATTCCVSPTRRSWMTGRTCKTRSCAPLPQDSTAPREPHRHPLRNFGDSQYFGAKSPKSSEELWIPEELRVAEPLNAGIARRGAR